MSRHFVTSRLNMKVAGLVLMLLGSSCAAAQQYSRREGESACASFDRCAVYDDSGKHDVACFQPAGEAPLAFAGDVAWPLTTAVCQPEQLTVPSAG
jgi:hypothetical protein